MSGLPVMKQYHPNASIYINKTTQETSRIYATETPESESFQILDSTMSLSLSPITPSPQQLGSLWIFGDFDYEIRTELEDTIQKNLRAMNIETAIAQIKARVWEFPLDVENFLRSNEVLIAFLDKILSTIRHRLTVSGGLLSGFVLQKCSDIEVPEMEDIEIIVKVGVKDYDVLLKLWEMVDEEVYQELPPEISRKLVVNFEKL